MYICSKEKKIGESISMISSPKRMIKKNSKLYRELTLPVDSGCKVCLGTTTATGSSSSGLIRRKSLY